MVSETEAQQLQHTVQVPTSAGYKGHAVAMILVSWYTATAGHAAPANFALASTQSNGSSDADQENFQRS